MFAEALAADRGAPLWDLGKFPVGSGSFLGKLTETHGISALPTVTAALSVGDYCVVFDALDEGYSLARSDNFEAFVVDLAKQVRDLAPGRAAIVACGRTDTVDVTRLLLEDSALTVCVMRLDFFSPDSARQFIDVQLDNAEPRHTAHRQYRAPFEDARDALFQRVEAAIGADDDTSGVNASSFLGYAPVLVALAGYLTVGNYQALSQHLKRDARFMSIETSGLWSFLRGIVVDLLEREQGKLVNNLPPEVQSAIPRSRRSDLYSPREQCSRLLARAAGSPAPTVDIPAAVLPDYEKAVNETLGEHPFVGEGSKGFASVVFRDYVLAEALTTGRDATVARGLAQSRGFQPSPLLVRFFIEAVGDRGTPEIVPDDLDLLYASANTEELGDARASLTIEQSQGRLDIEIIAARGDLLTFVVPNMPESRLAFGTRLARSDIHAPDWTVGLGRSGAEAVVGPGVTITCSHLVVSALSLRIEARTSDEAVTLEAARVGHEAAEFHLAGAERDRLRLFVEEQPAYPWASYVSNGIGPGGGADERIEDAVRELKKLATRFKPGPVAGNAPALPTKIMEVLVARGRVSADMHSYALETGLITVDGKITSLHPQQFGMNIVDLKERRLTPAVEDYLAAYVRSYRT